MVLFCAVFRRIAAIEPSSGAKTLFGPRAPIETMGWGDTAKSVLIVPFGV
jgi:hypothetical protein